ncbi:hypothetical protein ACFWVF_26935 [Streptomyces sp. NPDC058659]|uniref:SCO6745 family protein n=1 Tax=unclassified Streptomyces TaxID=2593676 RepID=UPI00365E9142
MWHLLEPLHALLYYAPEAFDEAAALGYDTAERWPSYFAWRSAPLGAPGPARVTSAFYSFSPEMVARYVREGDGREGAGREGASREGDGREGDGTEGAGREGASREAQAPADVLAARLRAVDRTYRSVLGEDTVKSPELAEAAALARRAAEAAGTEGRPLAAANAALPWPEAPHLVLWQAATILREHRGDGHLAALLVAGLDPVEALASFAAVGAAPEAVFESRGWSAAAWSAARARLAARGVLGADGAVTGEGRALRAQVELRTDELAAAPWVALGPDDTSRLAELLGGPWLSAIGSGLLPAENTLGIGKV